MFDNGMRLRHLPFFEAVAAYEEHQAEWRAATAGLVTLRLVDTWIEEGPETVAPSTWNVAAVLKAIEAMDDESRSPAILRSIVEAMQCSLAGDRHEVMPRIMSYGRALEYEAQWQLALDAYDTVVSHTHPLEESDTAAAAQQKRGFCLRTLGRFDDAVAAYSTAAAIAEHAGDMIALLHAKIGAANVAASRGNLPDAERAFERIATQAAELGLPNPQAHALDSRAAIAGFRGDHEMAVRFAYEALRVSTEPAERDRILNNIGMAFHMLGIRTAARDAFLVLSATAQEQYTRWAAMLSLMTLAAEDGSEPAFEQIRGQLLVGSMPPDIKTDYFIHLGRAQRLLQHEDLAEIAFAKAVQLAESSGLSRQLFEAEQELKVGRQAAKTRDRPQADEPLREVAQAIHALRVHATATVA